MNKEAQVKSQATIFKLDKKVVNYCMYYIFALFGYLHKATLQNI